MPGATPFQDKLKEYELKAPTVGMFGEISKDGESILEIAAWKRADEYCTFFASKPQVALSRIKQQMHREVGNSSMLHIVRNIRDHMELLELPGGGTYQPSSETGSALSTLYFLECGWYLIAPAAVRYIPWFCIHKRFALDIQCSGETVHTDCPYHRLDLYTNVSLTSRSSICLSVQ